MNIIENIALRIASEQQSVLTLVIGLPGSGKSTFAKSIPNASHYEADMYFVDDNGNYNFDRSQLSNAHKWCQEGVVRDLKNGKSVVVSNTGLTKWEREIYYKMAQHFGARIQVKTMMNDYGNIHAVPRESLERMKSKFEPISHSEISKYSIEVL